MTVQIKKVHWSTGEITYQIAEEYGLFDMLVSVNGKNYDTLAEAEAALAEFEASEIKLAEKEREEWARHEKYGARCARCGQLLPEEYRNGRKVYYDQPTCCKSCAEEDEGSLYDWSMANPQSL